jgi:hypothetical protein|tara:strand:- start:610 stop:813 length:204 start_codon:yes stop_codon:yes gene_type:complete
MIDEAVFVSPELVSNPPSPLKKLWDKEYMSDLKSMCSISEPGNKKAASRKQIKNTEIEIIGNRTSPK